MIRKSEILKIAIFILLLQRITFSQRNCIIDLYFLPRNAKSMLSERKMASVEDLRWLERCCIFRAEIRALSERALRVLNCKNLTNYLKQLSGNFSQRCTMRQRITLA